jgi:hypothetical protein
MYVKQEEQNNVYQNLVGNIPGKQRKISWDNFKMVQGNIM